MQQKRETFVTYLGKKVSEKEALEGSPAIIVCHILDSRDNGENVNFCSNSNP